MSFFPTKKKKKSKEKKGAANWLSCDSYLYITSRQTHWCNLSFEVQGLFTSCLVHLQTEVIHHSGTKLFGWFFLFYFIYVINLCDLNAFKVELGVLAASLTPHAITKFRLWREIGVKVLSARAVRCSSSTFLIRVYIILIITPYFLSFYPFFILSNPILFSKKRKNEGKKKKHQGVRGFLSCSAPRVQITVGAFWPVTVRVWCPWFSFLFILNSGSLPLSHSHKHTAISRHKDQRRDGGN